LLVLAGFANGIAGPSASALLRQTVAGHRHGLAFGTQQAGAPTALLLAGLAVPLIAVPFGWRWAFVAATVIALGAALAAPPAPTPTSAEQPPPQRQHTEQRADRTDMALLLLATGAASAVGVGVVSFLVIFATHTGMTPSAAGLLLCGLSLAAILGRITFGLRAGRNQRDPLATAPALFLACSVAVTLLATGTTATTIAGALLMGGLGWTWHGVLTLAIVQRNEHAPIRAVGLLMSSVFAGAIIGPLLVGTLAAQTSFRAAWTACVILSLLPLAAVILVQRRARASVTRPS
jgi:predicted MFS family arabinose efflux permease